MTSYRPARGRAGGRPSAAVLVGVALAVLVLVAVVVSLRTKNDDGGDQAVTTTSAAGNTAGTTASKATVGSTKPTAPDQAAVDRLIAAIPPPGPPPPADYQPLCREILAEAKDVPTPADLAEFPAYLARFDLAKVARLAPAGVRQSFLDLQATLPAATDAFDAAGGTPAPSDLPPKFLKAVSVVLPLATQTCPTVT